MFRNLDAEQARHKHSNEYVSKLLGISRVSYENKKRSGKFNVMQVDKLCKLYHCDFNYLFATENDKAS